MSLPPDNFQHSRNFAPTVHNLYQPQWNWRKDQNLLRGITDVKVPTSLVETLGAIRLWRRSVGRAEELRVTVDPLVLTGVLAKFAEGTAKLGGNQVAFRLATMRQQLDVDRANNWMLTGPHSWTQ